MSKELEDEKAGRLVDAARLARLERSLSTALQELAALREGVASTSTSTLQTASQRGNRACPDCATELRPVKLLDATAVSFRSKGVAHVPMSYASIDAKPSLWVKAIPSEGTIVAMLCPECGRTLIYANPSKD